VLVDSGKDCTVAIVILDGKPLSHTLRSSNVAGWAQTEYFIHILAEREFPLTTFAERVEAREMKEKFCYVPLDFTAEVNKWNQTDITLLQKAWDTKEVYEGYEMPNIEREQYLVGEAMFNPTMAGWNTAPSITQLMWVSFDGVFTLHKPNSDIHVDL
jgi:actin-related protein